MAGSNGAIERFPLLLGGVTLLIGVVDLGLWALAPNLASALGPRSTMVPNVALMLLLLGLALTLRQFPALPAGVFRSLGGLVMALSSVMLAEYAFGWQLGIDTSLFHEALMAYGQAPLGRPAVSTLVCMFLAGWSLLLLEVWAERRTSPSEWLALVYSIIPYVTILGYSYGVISLYVDTPGVRMVPSTAIALCCVAFGVLLDRASQGLIGYLSPDQPGGMFLRRFLPTVPMVPPLMGLLRGLGVYLGFFDASTGLTAMVVFTVLVGIWLLRWCADSVNRLDSERRRAEAEAVRREVELRQAQEISSLKDQFLSTMSHEIKTPITLLAGYTEILEDKYPDEELLKGVREGSDRLTETVNHILDYSALASGSLPLYLSQVDLGEVVHHAQSIKEADLTRQGIELEVRVDAGTPLVMADPRRMLQVTVELLDHLARYGQQGAPAHVNVKPCDHGACVEISERGWDLAARPEPVPTGSAGSPSSGLELALPIVRKLVELHGGRLEVRQAPDLGSVSVYLPEASAGTRPPGSRA